MAEVASAYVSLLPSAKGFGRGISNQIGGELDTAGRSGGQRLGKGVSGGFLPSIKGLMGPVAALFAVGAVVDFFKSANEHAREAQKVGALTANVIKTTGGAAKVTVGHVEALSSSISNMTGIEDATIQHGANLLLTFKNVRNEVGKGANIFDRATAAAADLSASGFGDLAGSSKQLGKALNDPSVGLMMLGRAGVTFTQSQKDQIKAMQKSGNLLGAQKLMMTEIESQVGGAAAASTTAGDKLTNTFRIFKETIGTALLPVIDKVANFLSTKLLPPMTGFITGMQDGTGAGGGFVNFLKGLWAVIQPVGAFIMSTVVPAVVGLFASFQSGGGPSAITGAFQGLVTFFQTQVVPAVMAIVTSIQGFVAVALPIVQAFVAGMMARIQPMMPTIRAIFGQIGAIVVSVMGLIQAVISRVTVVISFIWSHWGGSIMSFITSVWSKILVVIQAALTIIQGIIKTVTSIIKGDWSGAWNGIKMILSGVWSAIKGIISAALTYIGGIMAGAWALIKLGVSSAWGGIKGLILGALSGAGTWLLGIGRSIVQGLIDGVSGMAGFLGRAILTLIPGPIKGIVAKALGINSPSKVFAEYGRNTVQGFIVGVGAERGALESTMTNLVPRPRAGSLDFASSAARASAVAGSGIDYDRLASAMSRVRLDLDGRNVAASLDQRLAPR